MKKIIIFVLILGALIAVSLGIFLSFKTKELKGQIETMINQRLSHFQTRNIIKYEPFVCKGISTISCYSRKIDWATFDEQYVEDEPHIALYDVGFDINKISHSDINIDISAKNIVVEPSFKESLVDNSRENSLFHNLKPSIDDSLPDDEILRKQAYIENLQTLENFIPKNFKCNFKFSLDDDKIIEVSNCAINSTNAEYEISSDTAYKSNEFKKYNIAELTEFWYKYLFLNTIDDIPSFKDMSYKLNKILLKTKSKGFSEDIYKLYKRSAVDSKDSENKKEFDNEVDKFLSLMQMYCMFQGYNHKDMTNIPNSMTTLGKYIKGEYKELEIKMNTKDENYIPLLTDDDIPFSNLMLNINVTAK